MAQNRKDAMESNRIVKRGRPGFINDEDNEKLMEWLDSLYNLSLFIRMQKNNRIIFRIVLYRLNSLRNTSCIEKCLVISLITTK